MIVQPEVVRVLQRANLIGIKVVRVDVSWGEQVQALPSEPELYEIVIVGVSGCTSENDGQEITCPVCGRRESPALSPLVIDGSNWDGTDFFHHGGNPNVVLVTDRVHRALAGKGFSNYVCVPVQSRDGMGYSV